jgi:lysophospholipase L1-like esterase
MQPDTVHYTQAGYDAVAQAVNAALKNAGVHP